MDKVKMERFDRFRRKLEWYDSVGLDDLTEEGQTCYRQYEETLDEVDKILVKAGEEGKLK